MLQSRCLLMPTWVLHILQVCLLDNITEHLDVIRAFQLMLHRKRGRLGKSKSNFGSHSACSATLKAWPLQSRNRKTCA